MAHQAGIQYTKIGTIYSNWLYSAVFLCKLSCHGFGSLAHARDSFPHCVIGFMFFNKILKLLYSSCHSYCLRCFHVQQIHLVFPDCFKCPNQAQSGGLVAWSRRVLCFDEKVQVLTSSVSAILKSSIPVWYGAGKIRPVVPLSGWWIFCIPGV